MIGLIGIVVVFAMVFGGYLWAGGKMGVIVKALPYEMTMIAGAAVGAFMISNDRAAIGHTLADMGKVFRGPKWKAEDYRDLLCLLFELIRLGRQNAVALEEHTEDAAGSEIFSRYPRIQADREVVELICDTLRSASMNYNDPHQVEEVLDKRLDRRQHQAMHTAHALQTVADALPALGIVAAVLGVIKTMGSIDQPPEVLGGLIAGALVGTFLGVFLSYGFVGPFANRVKTVIEDDHQFHLLVREVLVANLHNHSTNICIEVGRQNAPGHVRPAFTDLEQALHGVKQASA
jgi:chemotaxis protein MotA